jgi:1-acyl-sn-glycerol-3-phosphate acyltransferase
MHWQADRAFIPPKPSPLVLGITRSLLPACLRSQDVVGVEYREPDLQRLRDLAQQRVAIFPNHPTGTDPAILFHLAKTVRQPFSFLAAREAFDMYWGFWGWLLQRNGAYSIIRGTADRAAFKMTRQLLAQPAAKLVVFPEGETYSQNDSLLPFHGGITQLLFWALDDLREAGVDEPLYVLPVALKYRFVEEMRPALEALLTRLEAALGLDPYQPEAPAAPAPPDQPAPARPDQPYADLYPRVRRIGSTVVAKLEHEYAVKPEPDADLSARMNRLKLAILEHVAQALHVAPRDETLPDRVRSLVNMVYQVTDEEPQQLCWYDRHLRDERRRRVLPLMRDLDRVANWIAVYDGYVSERPSPERMADLIRRLEVEVLGPWAKEGSQQGLMPTSLLRGKQRCLVHLGEPIDVAARYADYQADRKSTVQSLTHQFESATQALLDEMLTSLPT